MFSYMGHLYQHNFSYTKSHIVDAETKPGSISDHYITKDK